MKPRDIARTRLRAQHLSSPMPGRPADIVRHLGAVQSQDYPNAKWAIAQRLTNCTDADVEEAFARGDILRTHVLRPTWHFVARDDIRWMLALTAPSVHQAMASRHRMLEIDAKLAERSHVLLAKSLEGGHHLTRAELVAALRRPRLVRDTDDPQRAVHLITRAELDAVIISGAPRGKQQTYTLFDERVPLSKPLARDEALAELALRYFASHGPATLQDFRWWSGLKISDARAALEMVQGELAEEVVDGKTYWLAEQLKRTRPVSVVQLLPNFDEYVVGYTDRSAIFDPAHAASLGARENPLFQHNIIADGQIIGTWRRSTVRGTNVVSVQTFIALSAAQRRDLATAIKNYAKYLGESVTLRED
ncbi:MAG: winged helix DNA-binding domain-containing protein [Chloroflexota bacterium]